MAHKSKLIVKSADKTISAEIIMSVAVALLLQVRNIAEYKLKSEVKLKTN